MNIYSIPFIIISIVSIIFGILYLLSPRIMTYHEDFIGMKHEELNPKVAELMLVFLKTIGCLFIGFGTLGMGISVKAYPNKWAWYTVLIAYSIVLIPLLFITHHVKAWVFWLVLVLSVMFLIAITLPKVRCDE